MNREDKEYLKNNLIEAVTILHEDSFYFIEFTALVIKENNKLKYEMPALIVKDKMKSTEEYWDNPKFLNNLITDKKGKNKHVRETREEYGEDFMYACRQVLKRAKKLGYLGKKL